jgi:hypothetical protein
VGVCCDVSGDAMQRCMPQRAGGAIVQIPAEFVYIKRLSDWYLVLLLRITSCFYYGLQTEDG